MLFLSSADFQNSKNYFKINIRVSNYLDPDQARHFVVPTVCKGYQQTTLVGKE